MNIGSTGNDLDGLCTCIYLTDNQLIRIGMLLYFKNLTDNNFFKVLIPSCKTFNLGTCKSHGISVFLISDIKVRHIIFYP